MLIAVASANHTSIVVSESKEGVTAMTNSDEAAGYIRTHCQHLGSYAGDGSPYQFLTRVAKEMVAAPPTELFPERYKEHVACAIDMVGNHGFTTPQAAIVAIGVFHHGGS